MADLYLEYDAFIRSIKRNKDAPHAFLLGAGASISSGVPSAADCVWEWKRDIFTSKNPNQAGYYNNIKADAVKDAVQRWLDNEGFYPKRNAPEEYSYFANKAYPIPDDRRKYFQSLSTGKEPYVGYKLLALLAEAEIVKSVWTTNFDGLVVKVAHQMNLTPIEITLESVDRIYRNYNRTELLSIALHGDYKYGDLKNTAAELDSQNETFVKTLVRYLNDKNLIVIGYSGRDRSLMDALKSSFSEPGSGRLYWCGYGSEPGEKVIELIKTARANNREAYYISTDGFDKTMIHLTKSCFETDEDTKLRINEILKTVSDDSIHITPFSLDVRQTNYYIKSNLHPISIPREVFQFEIEYKADEKPWATIKEITKGFDIVAVPFKKKVFAVSTKSLINQVFNGRIKSDIVRVPISKTDVQKVSAFKDLVLSSILRAIASLRKLETDGKHKLWQSIPASKSNINEQEISVHKGVELSLFFDTRYAYISLKPAMHLDAEGDIAKEVRQSIGKRYFEKLFNNKYDEFLNFWRDVIFSGGQKLNFEFPINSGSALHFSIADKSPFAEIMISNNSHGIKQPQNYDSKLSLHKGVQFLEPQLVFTNKSTVNESRDFHPMRGLSSHRPYDFLFNGKVFSNEVTLGVICPSGYALKFHSFLNELNLKFPAGVNPDYLIDYPGFSTAYKIPINIPLVNDGRWGDISLNETSDVKDTALNLARLITTKVDQLASNHSQLIVTIFIPNAWQAYRNYDDEGERFDLHDYIKAYAAQRGVSTQLIEEDTITDSLKCQIFWWLSLSFYVKSLRTPWVLANLDKSTAFAGIGYSVNHSSGDNKIVLGCSHIYNSQGQGLKYKLSKVDDYVLDRKSNPFLSYNDAFQFGVSIRELFLNSMDTLPKRVVVHKRTKFTPDEIKGIRDSLSIAGIEKVDLIEIAFEPDVRYLSTRIYNNQLQIDTFPISRGICMVVEDTVALLWTHGIVPSVRNPNYRYYLGGRSIPAPLKITKHFGESNISTIATEILGLTKMDWNSFDLYTKLPATIQSSNEIARIGNLLSRFEGRTYDYRFFI